MSVEELRNIANELGIKSSKLEQMDLVYEILDKSAIVSAADKTAKQSAAKKRTRIKTVDRVYTANQEKAKKVDKTMKVSVDDSLFASLSDDEKQMMLQTQNDEKGEAGAKEDNMEQTAEVEETPKKRTRRTKKSEDDQLAEEAATSTPEAPKKRGRKPKKGTEEEMTTQEAGENAPANQEDNNQEVVSVDKTDADKKTEETATSVDTVESQSPDNGSLPNQKDETTALPEGSNADRRIEDVPLDNGSDFVILEDIPNEFAAQGKMDVNPVREISQRQQNTQPAQQRQAQNVQENTAPKEKAYDFSDLLMVSGVLETVDNYGFLRSADYNYLVSPDDVYVTQAQIKQYGLKTGDVVEGNIRPPKENEKFFTLVNVKKINGCNPTVVRDRVSFEYLTPLFPDEKFHLCSGDSRDTPSSRIVDLFAPIGKGQRALIVAQPKTGKTLLMKDIANSIARNHPDAYLMMLLIDERPEEVTDMARTVKAEVIASTFDAPAENHVKIAGLVLEKAKRMVECGHDVVIFLDSITRLARAYNTVSPASGKVLSGGVDANALQKPKRFFGAARNIENGGSLTIIATALIDTGSKMDEVIFEEFKGTGNMELQLDRSLSNKRVFPAVNLIASSTRRDDLLQDQLTLRRMWVLRKHISDMTALEAMDLMLGQMQNTKNNDELLLSMNN